MLIPTVPSVLSEEEGQSLLLELQTKAAGHIRRSSAELTLGVMCLDTIREERLYQYGGYDSWGPFLEDFKTHNGFSRSLTYDNLKVARLSMGGMKLTSPEVLDIGIDKLKPFTRLVKKYNRATGTIETLIDGVAEKLIDYAGETVGERLGEFIRDRVDPEHDTVVTVLQLLSSELPHSTRYTFSKVRDRNNKIVDLAWAALQPNGDEEAGYSLSEMPQHVEAEFDIRLRIRED